MNNENLLVACNLLSRVESLLEQGSRVQVTNETLASITEYISKALKYIIPFAEDFGSYLDRLQDISEKIDALIMDTSLVNLTLESKETLTTLIVATIADFRVAVGKYLCDRHFNFSPAMASVLNTIVDTCIRSGYYFGVEEEVC